MEGRLVGLHDLVKGTRGAVFWFVETDLVDVYVSRSCGGSLPLNYISLDP